MYFHGEMEILYWKNRIYVDTKKEQDELLCQYGSIRSHFFGVVICTVGFTAAVIVWLVSRRKKLEEDTERIINDWGIPF